MASWESQLRKGVAELAILAVLTRGEAYGYRVVEALSTLEGLNLSESTVYPILTRLANEGLLGVRTEPSPSGPPRRWFCLTLSGKKRLKELTQTWEKVSGSLSTLTRGIDS